MNIGYDHEASTEMEPKYFVYESSGIHAVVYKGTWTQCLVVVGATQLYPDITLDEIRSKSNGFI